MDCSEKTVEFPNFYWLTIRNWCEVKKATNQITNALDVRRECLWLNENIKVNKKQIKWNQWYTKGILQINDIVNQKGEFLSAREIEQKFDVKCNVMLYNKLKNVIPQKWRTLLKTMKIADNVVNSNEQIHLKIGKNVKPINQIKNKEIYWILVNKKQQTPIIIDKFKREYGIQETQWEKIFTIPKEIRDTKIRAFQYKLLYTLTPCNLYLKRIKKERY
jgi:hypothetical protein